VYILQCSMSPTVHPTLKTDAKLDTNCNCIEMSKSFLTFLVFLGGSSLCEGGWAGPYTSWDEYA